MNKTGGCKHLENKTTMVSGNITVPSSLQNIIKIIDPAKQYVSIETRRRSNAIDIPRMCADIFRLSSLGWSPVIDLKEGLVRTIREM
ncbi:MAG: hypothetical protein C3F06_07200 [Candidatus Methanoperedenaceae archaeon]|nr:MAG: hypothetical protein C3F06_07200 [Candidatus Methanoperedenaceae archaeon]